MGTQTNHKANTMSKQTDLIEQTVHTAVGEAPERNIENLQLVWNAAKETAETEGMGFMPRVMFHQACNEYFLSLCAK